MKDLDFDELDRAVSSLMTNVPKSGPAPDDDTPEKTLTLDPVSSTPPAAPATPDTLPASTPVASPASNSSVPTVSAAPAVPSVAVRRSGRFMDVVHPSADMKKPTTLQSPPSRRGVTIAPPARSATTPPEAPQPPETPTPVAPPASAMSQPAVESKTPANEWPDPLDVANFKDDSSPAPLTTPFLAGAKVDKRPLGGAPSDEPATEPTREGGGKGKDGLTTHDADAQLPAEPVDAPAPLPAELQGDLVAIESGAAAQQSEPSKSEQEPAKTPESMHEKTPMPLPTAPPSPEPAAKPGSVSIPQQYREEPSTGDNANGSIYDTANYHQPLAHPSNKKSSWLWVIWIVLILLIGAGAGAALYFFKLI